MLSKKDKSSIATTVVAKLSQSRPKPKGRKKKPKSPIPRGPKAHIDFEQMCLNDYATVVADPFVQGLQPCAPFGVTRPSDKYRVFGKYSWNAGTTGAGFIAFDPYKAYNNTTAQISNTTASSVGTGANALSAFTLLGTSFMGISPVPPDINNVGGLSARVRVVAAAMRTRCTHAPLSTAGDVTSFTARNNVTTATATPTGMFGDALATTVSAASLLNGDSLVTQWFPADIPDEDFFELAANFPTGAAATQGPLVCSVLGAAAGQSFTTEVVGFYEYVSVLAGGHSTKSASSPDTANKIVDFFITAPNSTVEFMSWFANAAVSSIELGSRAYVALSAAQRALGLVRGRQPRMLQHNP